MSKADNPQAFPVSYEANANGTAGMTLRDWFAGQALAGLSAVDAGGARAILDTAKDTDRAPSEVIASICFERADALLSERAKMGEG